MVPEFVNLDCFRLLQLFKFILQYLVYDLSVHLRSTARHTRCYYRVFKLADHVLSSLRSFEIINLLHNAVDRHLIDNEAHWHIAVSHYD